jgi:hypothetical protein
MYLEVRKELIFLIVSFLVISYNREMLGNFSHLGLAIGFFAVVFIYDMIKLVLFNSSIIPLPPWLYVIDREVFPSGDRSGFERFLSRFVPVIYRSGFPHRSLMVMEASTPPGATIYIFAPNGLHLDRAVYSVRSIVRSNLLKGVTYIFIIPNDEEGNRDREDLEIIHHDCKENLKFWQKTRASILDVAAENVMVISAQGSIRGIIQIPDDSKGSWWAEMSDAATKNYFRNILKLAPG